MGAATDRRQPASPRPDIGPSICPNGHRAIQRPGQVTHTGGGHVDWTCVECLAVSHDPCECGAEPAAVIDYPQGGGVMPALTAGRTVGGMFSAYLRDDDLPELPPVFVTWEAARERGPGTYIFHDDGRGKAKTET